MALLLFRCKGLLNPDHDTELYAALKLTRDASLAEIKRSFRWLSLCYHPDKRDTDVRRTAQGRGPLLAFIA